MKLSMTVDDWNRLSGAVIGAAIAVHRELGPGLLESAYEFCLARELESKGHRVARQLPLPIAYLGEVLPQSYRLDLVVDSCLIVEVKSVDQLAPIHTAQVLTYLRIAKSPLGLLINFNVTKLTSGVRRVVNGLA
jgi:GxxExxY protein